MKLCTIALVVIFLAAISQPLPAAEPLKLHLRQQVLGTDATGHNQWQVQTMDKSLPPGQTAIIICDMWDKHWSRGATERVGQMAPRMDQVVKAARAAGVMIIHAPSDTMDFYKDSPARKRMAAAPRVAPPAAIKHDDPPQPIDAADGGSDTGEKPWYRAWKCQHPAIEIDQEKDGISEDAQEIWNLFQQKGIGNVIIMGVHTNMCVLNRSFGIKQMVRWNINTVLARDLTDTMYNPARPPYVSHDQGTRLVIEYIEKFWCPTLDSAQLLGGGN